MRDKNAVITEQKESKSQEQWVQQSEAHTRMLKRIDHRKVLPFLGLQRKPVRHSQVLIDLQVESPPENEFPYKEIYAVFDHENYYVNTQRIDRSKLAAGVQRNPLKMT